MTAERRVAATTEGSGGSETTDGSGNGHAAHDCGNGGAGKAGGSTGAGTGGGRTRASASGASRGSNLTFIADRLDGDGAHELRSAAEGLAPGMDEPVTSTFLPTYLITSGPSSSWTVTLVVSSVRK